MPRQQLVHSLRDDQESCGRSPAPGDFPVALAEQCLRLHGVQPGTVMLDPFLGLGHSALAARECGVSRFIGFEIDAGYLREARERLGLTKDLGVES